jgi:hypothetical protein
VVSGIFFMLSNVPMGLMPRFVASIFLGKPLNRQLLPHFPLPSLLFSVDFGPLASLTMTGGAISYQTMQDAAKSQPEFKDE